MIIFKCISNKNIINNSSSYNLMYLSNKQNTNIKIHYNNIFTKLHLLYSIIVLCIGTLALNIIIVYAIKYK